MTQEQKVTLTRHEVSSNRPHRHECRHSIMFARACEKMGASTNFPTKASVELGRVFKAVASAETAYREGDAERRPDAPAHQQPGDRHRGGRHRLEMVNKGVYAAAGLNTDRAVEQAQNNAHHQALMRSSCAHLMDFLGPLMAYAITKNPVRVADPPGDTVATTRPACRCVRSTASIRPR